jgi:predicted HTH transcriptional regulator
MNELEQYLSSNESEKLEFKREFNDSVKEKLFKTICAFANDYIAKETKGVFIIGVNDDGTLSGYKNAKEDEAKINNHIRDWKISPQPKYEVKYITKDNNDIIFISIFPSNLPTWYNKEMYIRIGSSRREKRYIKIYIKYNGIYKKYS